MERVGAKPPTRRGGKRDRAYELMRGAKRADARARRLRAQRKSHPLIHPEHLHNFVAEVIDYLHRDPT